VLSLSRSGQETVTIRTRVLPAISVAATGLAAMLAASTAVAEITALAGGTVLDVLSGQYTRDAVVLIDDGMISAVGSAAEVPVPEEALRIDMTGQTLLPGLIDMHVHLTAGPESHGYKALTLSDERSAIYGVVHAERTLRAGFTTVRNVGARSYGDVALRDAINDGDIPGPRMFVSGPPVNITGGHCGDNNLLPPEYNAIGENVADGPWAVRKAVRRNVKYGVDLIKTCATGGVLSKGTSVGGPQYTLEELTAMVDEAHSHGLKVAAHAHGTEGILNALRAGVDTIEHGSFIDDEGIRLARKNGAWLTMDVYVTEYILGEGEAAGILPESLAKERLTGETQRANFRKALRAGVKMLFGTDAGVYPHGQNARQFSRMTRFGMTPLAALQSATVNAAAALGQEDTLGQLRAGFHADIVAVAGDPLQDISLLEAPSFVMKAGRVYLGRE
jgi:imidazolonepropionase-like amidohydrolase